MRHIDTDEEKALTEIECLASIIASEAKALKRPPSYYIDEYIDLKHVEKIRAGRVVRVPLDLSEQHLYNRKKVFSKIKQVFFEEHLLASTIKIGNTLNYNKTKSLARKEKRHGDYFLDDITALLDELYATTTCLSLVGLNRYERRSIRSYCPDGTIFTQDGTLKKVTGDL